MLSLSYENELRKNGYATIAGIDEAGRGPLAGPVVAAAVLFDFEEIPPALTKLADSKKLTARQRATLYDAILEHAAAYGIGIVDHVLIDEINILQATFVAMHRAIDGLAAFPDLVVIDGNLPLPRYRRPQRSVVDGDALIFSIAAASVLAKVTRDRLMERFHEQYPQYCFDRHKGYGTKLHLEALREHGPCEIHRRSFAPVKSMLSSRGVL